VGRALKQTGSVSSTHSAPWWLTPDGLPYVRGPSSSLHPLFMASDLSYMEAHGPAGGGPALEKAAALPPNTRGGTEQ